MSTKEGLLARLADPEDALVERKGNWNDREEVREAVVAFANSVRGSDTGVLFLGVNTDGTPSGKVQDADHVQTQVRKFLQKCYPPIANYQMYSLEVSQESIVAVVVSGSPDRPHFTGLCAVRKGSETIKNVAATEQEYQAMIEERNDVVWALRPYIGRRIVVTEEGPPQNISGAPTWRGLSGHLVDVNAHFVTFDREDDRRERLTFSLKRVLLERDEQKDCPRLRVLVRP
jgi:hypothetical protein